MMYNDAGWGWWMMGAGFLVVLLILMGGAVAVALAVRSRPGHGQAGDTTRAVWGSGPSASALEALDVRFARGEVDEEAYRRSRDLLTRSAGS